MQRKVLFFTILVWASLVGFAQESPSSVQKRSLPLTTRFKDCEEAITSLTKELHECDSLLALQPDSRPLIIERAICCNLLAEYHLQDLQQKDEKEENDAFMPRLPEDSVQLDEEPEHDLSYYYQQIIGYYQQSLQHADVLQSEPIAPYREYITYRWLSDYVPTLYNLLACNYGQFLYYAKSDVYYPFSLYQSVLYATPEEFVKGSIVMVDSASLDYLYFRLSQEVTKRNLEDHFDLPVIRWTLERLQKLLDKSSKQQLEWVEATLLQLATTYRNSAAYSDICYQLGKLYGGDLNDRWINYDSRHYQLDKAYYWYSEGSVSSMGHPDDFTRESRESCQIIKNANRFFELNMRDPFSPSPQLLQTVSYNCDTIYFAVTQGVHGPGMLFRQKDLLFDTIIAVERHGLFSIDTTLFVLPSLSEGRYSIWIDTLPFLAQGEKEHLWHYKKRDEHRPRRYVTNVSGTVKAVFSTPNTFTGIAMDYRTGAPVAHQSFKLTHEGFYYDVFLRMVSSKKDGRAFVKNPYMKDRVLDVVPTSFNSLSDESTNRKVACFYTDRMVYRPGQTVELKAIFAKENARKQLVPFRQKKIVLYWIHQGDNLLRTDTLKTNSLGSVASQLKLPDELQPGQVRVAARILHHYIKHRRYRRVYAHSVGWYDRTYRRTNRYYLGLTLLQVEEYKLPHFEVELAQPEGKICWGDSVTVRGNVKAYAGYDIHHAHITYKVYGTMNSQELLTGMGTVESDAYGNFELKTMLYDLNGGQSVPCKVKVTATDEMGETCDAEISFSATAPDPFIQFDLPEMMRFGELSQHPVSVRIADTIHAGSQVWAHYRIEQLTRPDHFMRPTSLTRSDATERFGKQFPQLAFHGETWMENWPAHSVAEEGDFLITSSSMFTLPNLPVGTYRVTWQPTGVSGDRRNLPPAHFSVYNPELNVSPLYVGAQAWVDEQEAYPGDTVHFHLCSAIDQGTLYADLFSLRGRITAFNLTDCHYHDFSYVVQPEDSVELLLMVHAAFDGQVYSHSVKVALPQSLPELHVEWLSCDTSAVPREKKQVRLRLTFPDGRPAKAEVLCAMYDAALDSYVPNYFSYFPFTPSLEIEQKVFEVNAGGYRNLNNLFRYHLKLRGVPQWNSPRIFFDKDLLRFGHRSRGPVVLDADCCTTRVRGNRSDGQAVMYDEMVVRGSQGVNSIDGELYEVRGARNNSTMNSSVSGFNSKEDLMRMLTPRTNFAETAFFYPWLETDDNGEVVFDFTLPESLTRWKLMGVAHTASMTGAVFSTEMITHLPVMSVPHLPRFLYEGDSLLLAVNAVTGLSLPVQGDAYMRVTVNRNTEVASCNQSLTWDTLSSQKVRLGFVVPQNISNLGVFCRVYAQKGTSHYTDSEQRAVPVLSRRQLVTESVPFFITRRGSRSFALPQLANSSEIVNCHLTFTPDPTWDVVFSLPDLIRNPYPCSDHLLSEMFGNLALAQLLHDCPISTNWSVQNDTARWQNAPALWRRFLESNLVDFSQLDELQLRKKAEQLQKQLVTAQNSDGCWPWFRGGYSSSYVTRTILMDYGRMKKLGWLTLPDIHTDKAVKEQSKEVERNYQSMLQHNPAWLLTLKPTASMIEYLYIRTLYADAEVPFGEADKFYLSNLEVYADEIESLYLRGLAALVLHAHGKDSRANGLMRDIRREAHRSEALGMYWPSKNGRCPDIRVQVVMMEAFDEILHDTVAVREMKLWLLQQKRSQYWMTTGATVQACVALLQGLAEKRPAQSVTLQVGGVRYDFADTLQVPFVEKLAAATVATTDSVVVTRSDYGFSYGTLTWQQWVDIDSIPRQTQEQPLHIERQLWLHHPDGSKPTLVKAGEPLHLGDQVTVRLIVYADRAMDFVRVCDLRAATFEPGALMSGYQYGKQEVYYRVVRDTEVDFFLERLTAGQHVIEYPLTVSQAGKFSGGYATVESFYAPEFNAHTPSKGSIVVEE